MYLITCQEIPFFASFLIVSLTPFINKLDSSKGSVLTISFTCSHESINVVTPDLNTVFWIAASVADAAVVNPKRTIALLANVVSTFFINGKLTFIKGPRKLSNPSFWLIIFPLVPFNKIPLFSKELIASIIYFISMFVSVIPEQLNIV